MIINNEQSRKEIIEEINSLDLDNVYSIKITQKRGKRSIDQNALYWMWLTCIEQETGNERNDLHEYFKRYILGAKEELIFGKKVVKSTTILNTAEFTQYLEKIQQFANVELSITLPNPEDLKFEQFKDYYSKFI